MPAAETAQETEKKVTEKIRKIKRLETCHREWTDPDYKDELKTMLKAADVEKEIRVRWLKNIWLATLSGVRTTIAMAGLCSSDN